jgi:hypothetical protein
LFEPAMLGSKFSTGGAPMLGLAVLLGLIGGAWIGRDVRKELAKQESVRPDGDADADGRDKPN